MLYLPGIFGEDLMDDWMDDFDKNFFSRKDPLFGHHAKHLMRTDVRENADSYEIDVDLPGFKRDEIHLSLNNGYLNIAARKELDKEQSEKKDGRIIRQERYAGSLSRAFYVGDQLRKEDFKAKLEHGVLKLTFPKQQARKTLPTDDMIMIDP